MTLALAHRIPRSGPARSAWATYTRLTFAEASASTTSIAKGSVGGPVTGEFMGTAITSAPASASPRMTSGKKAS